MCLLYLIRLSGEEGGGVSGASEDAREAPNRGEARRTGSSREQLEHKVQPAIEAFLEERGLRLSKVKGLSRMRGNSHVRFLEGLGAVMLALVCILKTGPLPRLPQNSIGLIRRALDPLTFRWDEQKGIARVGEMPLDGEERIRCLMRIAFRFGKPYGPESVAFAAAQEHLRFIQRSDVSASRLMTALPVAAMLAARPLESLKGRQSWSRVCSLG